jgi:para-nitrobenzyl esterase
MRFLSHAPAAFACLLLCSGLGGPTTSAVASEPVVSVTGGDIRGRLLEDGAGAVFKGIPFARPPVGDFRWREPMPVIPWNDTRDAGESGPPAVQPALGWNDKSAAASREDCLYLDVWTPTGPSTARNPVMVWIHGGANVAGAGGFDPLYDGRALISHGAVLVVVEYRLGILGFFAHPELTRESAHHASGNYATLDQIAALRWVRDNIGKFGGDPENVTIFGQSAGATDVLALMASPLSKGLFHRAIAESGAPSPRSTLALGEAEEEGARAGEKRGAQGGRAVAFLRSLPPGELLKTEHSFSSFTADGWVFPTPPVAVWASGREHAVPLIIGSNGVEFPAAGSPDDLRQTIHKFFGDLAPRALALYGLSGDGPAPDADPVYGDAADQLGSDVFRCPSVLHGEWHSGAGHPVWEYEFDRAIPPHPKVAHSGDLSYVFGNLHPAGSQGGDFQDADRRLSAVIQAYWTNFARTGNPNDTGLPKWPGFDAMKREYLVFTAAADVAAAANERGPFCDLYRALLSEPAAPR